MLPHDEALKRLRESHKQYVRNGNRNRRNEPYQALSVHGWVYLPVEDRIVTLQEFNRRMV